MTTLSFKIPDDLAKRFEALAEARQTTRSELFREALIEKIADGEKGNTPSLLERAGDLCGAGRSGLKDLSTNPTHLDGFGS